MTLRHVMECGTLRYLWRDLETDNLVPSFIAVLSE